MAIGSIVIVIYILLVQTTGSRDIQQGWEKQKTKIGSNIYKTTNVLPDFKIVPWTFSTALHYTSDNVVYQNDKNISFKLLF